jgi:PEP-CTERM/exosortase A-associated glycosyltransferase
MKILHVLENSLPNLAGYTIRAKYIVENQKKHGMNPLVVTSPFFRNDKPGTVKEAINGIWYYRTNFIKSPESVQNKIMSFGTRLMMLHKYKNAVLELARKEKPDIIHAHSSYTNGLAASYASEKTGIPSIYELRSLWGESAVVEDGLRPGSLKYKMIWGLELKAMKKADLVIAISQGIKKEIMKKGISPDKINIMPNGVDSTIFFPMEKSKEILEKHELRGCPVIGYIGSIRKLEGLSYVIDALPSIQEKIPNVKVLIVGDGPEKKKLEQQTEQKGLKGIIFADRIEHEKILQYYSVFDLFVFPRIDATINHAVTPLKPLEAMACGKVCICSDVGGLTELIKDKYNGSVFKKENARDLADKVISLLELKDEYNKLRSNGLDWVKAERDWSVLIPRYIEIYKKITDI